jgi:hypothetical protein
MPSAIVETTVIDASDGKGIVSVRAGHNEHVAVGDSCWFFNGDGMIGHGEVFLVSDVGSAVRLNTRVTLPASGDAAVMVTESQLTRLRDRMPAGATIRGRLVRLPPGRRTGWTDIGQSAALRLDDSLLVWRSAKDKRIPIARGRVALLHEQTALLALQPLVANAQPGPGDDVELWPAPAEGVRQRLTSTVIAIDREGDSPIVRIIGTAQDGLAAGRLVDLYRDGRFVGVAGMTTVADPLSAAEVIVSASIDEPAVGDRAIVRTPIGPSPQPVRAVVFNIQGDVCLLAAGEADGIRVGEKLVVRRAINDDLVDIAELTVYTVKVDYAGARIRLITPENHPIQKWDFAERRTPRPHAWRTTGRIRRVMAEARTAFAAIEAPSTIVPGQVVRITTVAYPSESTGTAIVLHATDVTADLYVPPGWGAIERFADARIEILDRRAALTQPAQTER